MEWLANLTVKWVLVAVGVLLLARAALIRAGRHSLNAQAAREFVDSALIAVVVVFLVIRPYLFQAYFIPSESMRPTLWESDRILVNKLVFRFSDPKRGEILVFRPPEDRVPEQKDYVKRVIGLPGEVVEVVPERLLVDGRTLLRITRAPASSVMRQNFRPEASVGFTFPLESGRILLDRGLATITGEFDGDLKVATYLPGDRIETERNAVFLNKRSMLATVFGKITASEDIRQWGGDADLTGHLYCVDDTPRLLLVRGRALGLDEGHVLLNGERLHEPYILEEPEYAMPPLRIPPGQYFVMGDNRNRSFDSHAWGPLARERVLGRAEFVFWPFSHLHAIRHAGPH